MHRPKFLLNADPEVARAYFEGQNSYKRGVSEEKKWAPSDAEGGPTPGTGSWGMLKEKISKPNGQGGPYKEGAGAVSYIKNFLMGPFGSRSVDVNLPKTPKKILHPLDMEKFLNAIKANETSIVRGNVAKSSQFSGVPKLGRAMGDYRVTEGELASYAPRYMGRKVTPQEFQNYADIQREYMKGKANWFNKEGYTPQETADIHNKGMTNSFPAGSGQYQNPDYVNKFNVNYNAPNPQLTLTQ
jgi:hypothetical protein